MTQARFEDARLVVLAGLLALVAAMTLPPGPAALASLSFLVGAGLEARRVRRLVRDLREVEAYTAVTHVERERIVLPDATPRVSSPEARALVARVKAAADRAERAAKEIESAREADARSYAVRARFTAAMGHELKTPLTSIVGFAALLERRAAGELGPAQRESVAMIRRGAEDLLRLLGDLLDSAKLDVGRLALELAFVPAVEVLTQAATEARAIVEGRSITIESTFQPGLPPIRVDRARLVQAIVGVFRHAARGLDRGTLVLAARRAAGPHGRDQLAVEVHDPRRALSGGEIEHLFDPFRSPRTPGGGRPGGLGLALSVARRLVRLHGGDITAVSAESDGTRFVVSVPLDE